jgi:predicted aldo/keto reductase-like oxidoreductase
MQRRVFVGTVFSALASVASAQPPKPKSGGIATRPVGRTGDKVTMIGMGGARFHLIPFEEGTALVRRAYDLGINYFDMARGYNNGHAEEVYGAVIPEFRKNIFLTSKTGQRTRQGAEADLEKSLKAMRTDHLDLWQMHSVGTKKDIASILAPGGALEAFVAAKKAGKVRFIGFTGHADPDINLQLLRSFDGYDTVFMPLHLADTAYMSFEKGTLPAAVERGMGVFAMKIFASAYNLRAFSVRDCLSYTLTLPISGAALGFTTMGQLEDDVRIAQNFKPRSNEEMDAIRVHASMKHREVNFGPTLEYWKVKDQ